MTSPKYLTFDCYGTLCNFDLTPATLRVLGPRKGQIDLKQFFDAFRKVRFEETLGEYRPYKVLLPQALERVMKEFGMKYRPEDGAQVVEAVRTFGPFPEVPAALERLRKKYKLVIMSNSDDDIIVHNVRNIGVPFDEVITAEQARAYKPSPTVFEYTLRKLGCEPSDIIHVAQGFDYDIMACHKIGWSRIWINRYGRKGDPAYGPYQELPDLSPLPERLGA